jgi:hypothetical protein
MSFVATAIVGAAVVGGVATDVASSNSANATEQATNANISQQQSALNQQAQLSQPYRDLGSSAIPTYESLLGIGPQGAAGIGPALQNTPGYQFTQSQGETGILNAASTGGGVGGNTIAALDTYNTGLASGTYQNEVADIGGAVASGQAAAAGQAQNVGTAAQNIGTALTNQGQTIAGIDSSEAAALTKVAGNASNAGVTAATIGALNSQGGAGDLNNPAAVGQGAMGALPAGSY